VAQYQHCRAFVLQAFRLPDKVPIARGNRLLSVLPIGGTYF
jgi:hypothetical protein